MNNSKKVYLQLSVTCDSDVELETICTYLNRMLLIGQDYIREAPLEEAIVSSSSPITALMYQNEWVLDPEYQDTLPINIDLDDIKANLYLRRDKEGVEVRVYYDQDPIPVAECRVKWDVMSREDTAFYLNVSSSWVDYLLEKGELASLAGEDVRAYRLERDRARHLTLLALDDDSK